VLIAEAVGNMNSSGAVRQGRYSAVVFFQLGPDEPEEVAGSYDVLRSVIK
jgi:hypothetical protein